MNDPALLELFTRLREAGLPLGLAEYHLLLQAMHAGFGTRDRTALAQLCSALWVKSEREMQIFQNYFDQLIPEQAEQILFEINTDSTTNQQQQPVTKISKLSRDRRFLLIGIAACIVAIGSALFLKNSIPQTNNLAFNISFPFSYFLVDIKKKAARIKIIRTGSKHGEVTAKLKVNKECFPDDSQPSTQSDDSSQLIKNPGIVKFADGEVGEKILLIPIVNNNKADFFQKTVTLCLTEPQGIKLGQPNRVSLIIENNSDYSYSEIVDSVLIAFTCMIMLLVAWKWRKTHQSQNFKDETIVETNTNLPKTVLPLDVTQAITDEIQAAQTIRLDNQLGEFPLIVNDLPVTHRQMKQGWRYLRQFTREGAPVELDLEATIQQVAQEGFLLNPVLVPPRTNQIELLLLIDRDGSMVPFHHLAQALVDTASRGGRFSRVRVYYFHNCPDEYLYRDRYHLEAEPLDDCLLKLPKTRTVCLIFSDAGAARGGFSSRRRRLTKFFLKQLGEHVRYVTWLNPVPRKRWQTTTAQDIATLVPMFEMNRQELYRAIDTLRGRHQTLEEALN